MNTLPFEVIEEIIQYIPDYDLFRACYIDKVWYIIARNEAYKRWKKYELRKNELPALEDGFSITINRENTNEELAIINQTMSNWGESKEIRDGQICIMRCMLDHGMIVDDAEKKLIKKEYDDWLNDDVYEDIYEGDYYEY